MLINKCKNCGEDFKVGKIKRKYCSAECRNDFKRKKMPKLLKKICDFCSKDFTSTTKATKFCSMKCNGLNIAAKARKRKLLNIKYGKKICSRCGEIKKLTEFYTVRRCGSPSWCKKCKLDQNKKYAKNPEVAARKKAWRKKYNISTADLRKFSRMKRIYGITFEEYMEMMNSQNGKCVICKDKLIMERRGIHIDHCHNTDKVRGLLCNNCNAGLGFFKENKESLRNAIQYLEKNSE